MRRHVWTISSVVNVTRFHLSCDGLATDRPEMARIFDTRGDANNQAKIENQDPAWQGFHWFRFELTR